MRRVTALGWRADAALRASEGHVRVVAALSGSLYGEAAGELVWLGEPGAALHARAVLALDVPRARVGATVTIARGGLAPWRPERASLDPARARTGARSLRARLAALGPARGLGRLLVEAGDDVLGSRARPHLVALAGACVGGDGHGVARAARGLLGLGGGLTPSGDDCVGGALFARSVLAPDAADDPAIAALLADARAATHPISARLLADLAAGEGWAPLHALVRALGRDPAAALAAARSTVALGHTSGWDLLAGMLAALLGPDALAAHSPAAETRPL